jgi:hypothetical protein
VWLGLYGMDQATDADRAEHLDLIQRRMAAL